MPWQFIYLMNMIFSKFCESVDTQTYTQEATIGDGSKFTPTQAIIA